MVRSHLPRSCNLCIRAATPQKRENLAQHYLICIGMAASRVGLWSFDLIQLKQLQEALVNHPRRNTLTALQFSMANMADLLKYILAMILSRPVQFPWAAIISFVTVSCGAITYTIYLKRERGHIFHVPCLKTD